MFTEYERHPAGMLPTQNRIISDPGTQMGDVQRFQRPVQYIENACLDP